MHNFEKVPYYTRIAPRLTSWFNPTVLAPQKLRMVILGTIVSGVLGEVSAYKLLKQNVKAGELNALATDFIIVSITILTAFVGPLVAWYGHQNRRVVMLAWNAALALIVLFWFAMPSLTDREEYEYCHSNNIILSGIMVTPKAAVRLSILTLSSIIFILTRVAVWSHGVAHIDEHAPAKTSVHFGLLTAAHVLLMVTGDKILTSHVETNLNLQIFGLFGSTVGNIVQALLFMPKSHPAADENFPSVSKTGFFASINRILQNTLAMSQMVAIGLLAAALWGFAYHEGEIIKVLYHIDIRDSSVANTAHALQYIVVIIAVVYVGVKFSAPVLSEFCKYRGIKQATAMSVIALVFYVLLTVVGRCENGRVAGLENRHYNYPNCSSSCYCIPRWNEFSPVCVVDQTTSYLSPCQAGCSSSETVDNIRVYTNCSCAPGNGRATIGACSINNCHQSYQLHLTFVIMVVMVTVLAFQAQSMILLRSVNNRDKSVALGVTASVVSVLTFVCGHLIYLGITAATCRWYQAGKCHLQSEMFPIFITSTSSVMALLSVIISITTWICWKVAEKNTKKNDDLDGPEESILLDR